jgi:hypothetical protein
MTKEINHEEIARNAKRLVDCKTSDERIDILIDSIGYLGLATAYLDLTEKVRELEKNQPTKQGEE